VVILLKKCFRSFSRCHHFTWFRWQILWWRFASCRDLLLSWCLCCLW
jgi:hypothetical protein